MRKMVPVVVWMCAASGGAGGQTRAAAPPVVAVYGSVAGHVACSDTNGPARLASVTLQTINVKVEDASSRKMSTDVFRSYQTGLDGSFAIPKVSPGTYYVLISKPGYMSPITQFTRAELTQPTPEILTRIMKAVPMVTVEANHTSNLDVRIERGAALTGTVRYDDGTPMAGTRVMVLTRETKGGKTRWVNGHNLADGTTDDRGEFRMTGLPPGEYLLEARVETEDRMANGAVGGMTSSWSYTRFSLNYYPGDTPRQDQGKPVKLQAGEDRDGVDITIPVSKLHSVSGVLTDKSGHVVNAGRLALLFPDGAQLASTSVDKEDSQFHFEFVPEGEYTLTVADAKDVVREEISAPAGTFPPSSTKETTVREYGTASQPLVVGSDAQGVVVNVVAKGKVP